MSTFFKMMEVVLRALNPPGRAGIFQSISQGDI